MHPRHLWPTWGLGLETVPTMRKAGSKRRRGGETWTRVVVAGGEAIRCKACDRVIELGAWWRHGTEVDPCTPRKGNE